LFILFVAVLVDAKHVLARCGPEVRKLQTRNRVHLKRNTKHAAGGGAQCAERVTALFFGGDVFEITLLLFDAHVAESCEAFELRADSFAEVRQRDRLDVERVGAWQLWFGFLLFAILVSGDGFVSRDYELRAILEHLDFAGDSPETGFEFFLRFESFAPDLE